VVDVCHARECHYTTTISYCDNIGVARAVGRAGAPVCGTLEDFEMWYTMQVMARGESLGEPHAIVAEQVLIGMWIVIN
jgi:hypothetical protein